MKLSIAPIYRVANGQFSLISRDDGGVLLLPIYAGESFADRPPASFALDGLDFAETTVDVSQLPSPQTPTINPIGRRFDERATENDLLFVQSNGQVFELSVGAEVSLRPSAYQSPEPYRFTLHALTFDSGLWWAGGQHSHDDLLGELHYSEDGISWKKVPGDYDAIRRLVRLAGKLYGLWFKNVDEVSRQGLKQAAKFKTHVEEAAIGEAGIVGSGSDFGVGTLAAGAKRAKYSKLLKAQRPGMLISVAGGFLLGDHEGLWASQNGSKWEIVADFTTNNRVAAMCASKNHAVVLSSQGEVFAIRCL